MRRPYVWMMIAVGLISLAAPALAGDVEGTVSITSSLRPRATGRASTGDNGGYGYGGGGEYEDKPPALSRAQEIAHVVISLTGRNLPATPRSYVVRQKGREFIPHVLPVVKGSSVVFTNEDPFLHSIYSESPAQQFILKKYARGKRERRTFDTPGPVELFCNIHSRMNAYIYVVENDFFTQPGSDRRFALRNLPAGTYSRKVWHPRANPQVKTITVPASGTVNVDLSL